MHKLSNPKIRKRTKKDMIISLFLNGIREIHEIAHLTRARPTYVATVLQKEGLVKGYFDLYTSTKNPMNIYSKIFTNQLGFKDQKTVQKSLDVLSRYYDNFEKSGDRAGQHHTLTMALTMLNRARWMGKTQEANAFSHWLFEHLDGS